ncbi:MAG: pyrimidine-nucleoside phosphorylase [Bacilli bacterium]|nr:pyrimidine-nucleoside phosphorylase [Bacilli bacterium]MCH4201691.1 pyrimidine-nucleoside phosphorylase [Bacilli bacterium]MCH4235273.1 pyrimidine-nucleoside phosphorylase [Bacilli bacterium]
MRMADIITKKRDGGVLSEQEINFFVEGYTKGTIPDYQASALAMAIVFQGMNKDETVALTKAMMYSGDVVDLSQIKGVKVDKHSTGGVGDKTSMVVGPIVASCGVRLAKMSGRGLGHTGGTLDKLESIPGMSISLPIGRFIKQVNDIGIAIIGQTADLVPADKKLYALRDVTGTVESIPLIASSIMSKKLASGADTILLDVKFGSGAFMKTIEDARKLARTMVEIGDGVKRDTRAILTDMDQPLGRAVGNNLEVKEAIDTLNGHGPDDFVTLCIKAAGVILVQGKVVSTLEEGEALARAKIKDGSALNKFKAMVKAQGGDVSYIDNPSQFVVSKHHEEVYADADGYVGRIDCLEIGVAAMQLGAGRATKDDVIDPAAGIIVDKKVGAKVSKGDKLADIYTDVDAVSYQPVIVDIQRAFKLQKDEVTPRPIVYEIIE